MKNESLSRYRDVGKMIIVKAFAIAGGLFACVNLAGSARFFCCRSVGKKPYRGGTLLGTVDKEVYK